MKEKLEEIFDGLQERLKSPFIVTFIIVWSLHHWKLLFIIFSFDNDLNQGYKKSIIEAYIHQHDGWCGMFIYPILWSFLSVLAYYFISLMYEGINLLYERYGRPLVNMLDKNKLALKEEVDKERKKIKELRSEVRSLQQKESELNEEIKSFRSQVTTLTSNVDAAGKREIEFQNKLEKRSDYDTIVQDLEDANKEIEKLKNLMRYKAGTFFDENGNVIDNALDEAKNEFIQRNITEFNSFNEKYKLKDHTLLLFPLLHGTWKIKYSRANRPTSEQYFVLKNNNTIEEGSKVYKIKSSDVGNRFINITRSILENGIERTEVLHMNRIDDNNYSIIFDDNTTTASLQRTHN